MRLPLGLVTVRGRSMEPTLHEGDRLVVLYGAPPLRGRLSVVRLPPAPDGPRPLAVKRVTARDPGVAGSWWVERDNPAEGTDSWTAGVGGIPRHDVVALVLVRLRRTPGSPRRARRTGPERPDRPAPSTRPR